MHCYSKKDLNPVTCRFTKRCKPHYERNHNFLCRRTKKNNILQKLNSSPLTSIVRMKQSVQHEPKSAEHSKRVFPKNCNEITENGKNYLIFEDPGTGIMLADTLYKNGNMVQLSKALSKTHTQPPFGWYLSEKYDGLRGIWTGKELVARPSKKDGVMKGKVFNYVPDWFINLLPKGISLDGEIWLGRGRFQEIAGLSNYKISKKITREFLDDIWKDVKFMVFDIPHMNEPYIDRLEKLKSVVDSVEVKQGFESPIKISVNTVIKDHAHLAEIYTEYTLNGAEGIILRDPNSLYETKRSKLLLKMKLNSDSEAVVIDYVMGTGKYTGLLGSLKCEMNGKTFHIGTGFNDVMRNEYNDPESSKYIPIGATVNFAYMELTKDGIPRHPVYRGVRTDI